MSYSRFAVYFLPRSGSLADFGARWLGWDAVRGHPVAQPDIPGLDQATQPARRYGFHATLKPPFRLAGGMDANQLAQSVKTLAQELAPARAEGLQLSRLGRFLALTPVGQTSGINRVAAACVTGLDALRAPPDANDLARRRGSGLRTRQEELLKRWGYPHVLDEFRFHMTLTGRLPKGEITYWEEVLKRHLPPLPAPLEISEIALMGERGDGNFELIDSHPLLG